MKATGIIRRVDDLGRVVIPKEIRRQCGIREGEALEIYVDKIGSMPCVCFAKYATQFGDELNKVKEHIADEMDCCGEHELSGRFKQAIAEAAKILKEFEERG